MPMCRPCRIRARPHLWCSRSRRRPFSHASVATWLSTPRQQMGPRRTLKADLRLCLGTFALAAPSHAIAKIIHLSSGRRHPICGLRPVPDVPAGPILASEVGGPKCKIWDAIGSDLLAGGAGGARLAGPRIGSGTTWPRAEQEAPQWPARRSDTISRRNVSVKSSRCIVLLSYVRRLYRYHSDRLATRYAALLRFAARPPNRPPRDPPGGLTRARLAAESGREGRIQTFETARFHP